MAEKRHGLATLKNIQVTSKAYDQTAHILGHYAAPNKGKTNLY